MANTTFKLSAQLAGHTSDVKAVAFQAKDVIVSASRDSTVRIWTKTSATPPRYDSAIVMTSGAYVNSLAMIPPSVAHPSGLIASSGHDPVIYIHQPKPEAQQDPGFPILLPGHSNNVCTLDVSPEGKFIASGGWDSRGKVWNVGKWDLETELDGHEKSVTAILAYDKASVITGCADNMIRSYSLRGTTSGDLVPPALSCSTHEPVRALCRLTPRHPSGAAYASASNDAIIRLWTLKGQQVAELHGHEAFVYSLACLPSGEIVSAGEDRTVRIWKDNRCIQTISHPAISVWGVAACPATGDIVSGASDGVVRVWTRSQERAADADTLKHFEDSVKASAIPKETLGDNLSSESFPGPEFLEANVGKKDGQIQVIRNPDGQLTAHSWSSAGNKWELVGSVVSSAGSSDKKTAHDGKEWDFVLRVDIEDGKPTLPLPYNVGENPYDASRRFLEDNDLPISYLEQVARFIEQETKGVSLDQRATSSQDTPGASGSGVGDVSSKPPAAGARLLPQKGYVLITALKSEPVLKKTLSLNSDLVRSGNKDFALNPSEVSLLQDLVSELQLAISSLPVTVPSTGAANTPASLRHFNISSSDVDLILKIAVQWDYQSRLPGLDLLRCLALFAPAASHQHRAHGTIVDAAIAGAFSPAAGAPVNVNAAMMAMRTAANIFATEQGRAVAASMLPRLVPIIEAVLGIDNTGVSFKGPLDTSNRNLSIALTSVALNYAVLAWSQVEKNGKTELSGDQLLLLTNALGEILQNNTDPATVYRAVAALGTLAHVDGLRRSIKEVGAASWARTARDRSSDTGVKDISSELIRLLS